MRHPLLVTDQALAKLPLSRGLVRANQADGIETAAFSRISSDLDGESIAESARMFLEGGYDCIIALGGGSSLDAGKAVALAFAVGP